MRTYKTVTVSMPEELIQPMMEKIKGLGVTKSLYLQQLVRKDLGLPSVGIPEPKKGPRTLSTGEEKNTQ